MVGPSVVANNDITYTKKIRFKDDIKSYKLSGFDSYDNDNIFIRCNATYVAIIGSSYMIKASCFDSYNLKIESFV